MSDELSEFFNLNGTQIGNLAASYFYAYLIMQVPAGILLDEFGPREVLSVCLFGHIDIIAIHRLLACLYRALSHRTGSGCRCHR